MTWLEKFETATAISCRINCLAQQISNSMEEHGGAEAGASWVFEAGSDRFTLTVSTAKIDWEGDGEFGCLPYSHKTCHNIHVSEIMDRTAEEDTAGKPFPYIAQLLVEEQQRQERNRQQPEQLYEAAPCSVPGDPNLPF